MAKVQLLVENGEIKDKQIRQDGLRLALFERDGFMPQIKLSLESDEIPPSYICLDLDNAITFHEALGHIIDTGIDLLQRDED